MNPDISRLSTNLPLRPGLRVPFRRKFVAGFLVACFFLSTLPAQSLREPEFMAQASPGFDCIYNLDYDQAERIFLTLRKQHPQHPAPPLYLGVIAWLRELFRRQDLDLDLFLSPAFFTKETSQVMPPEQRKAFFDYLDECRSLAQGILGKNPKNTDAIYFLGAAQGILGSFSITIDHSVRKAFSFGNKAYDYDRQVLKLDPKYYDAFMTVGLYQYIVGSIPWYIKWLATLVGYRGTKEEGFKAFDLAVTKGEYVRTDAKILEMVLLMHEGQPKDALRDAQELHRDFPRNYIFQINIAQIQEKLGQADQAVSEYLEVVHQAETGKPNYSMLPLATFRYTLGNKLFKMGRLAAAEDQLRKSIANSNTPEREQALSQLRLGQVLDLQGKRAEAVQRYQAVLKMKDVDNSQDMARKFLQRPYRG
ncbi:MAG: tetratricopeptide repeat protein [Acidobacteriia bacterium]|nr:tetratricopeptide repeat protein [Terriglobia bacterium]